MTTPAALRYVTLRHVTGRAAPREREWSPAYGIRLHSTSLRGSAPPSAQPPAPCRELRGAARPHVTSTSPLGARLHPGRVAPLPAGPRSSQNRSQTQHGFPSGGAQNSPPQPRPDRAQHRHVRAATAPGRALAVAARRNGARLRAKTTGGSAATTSGGGFARGTALPHGRAFKRREPKVGDRGKACKFKLCKSSRAKQK